MVCMVCMYVCNVMEWNGMECSVMSCNVMEWNVMYVIYVMYVMYVMYVWIYVCMYVC